MKRLLPLLLALVLAGACHPAKPTYRNPEKPAVPDPPSEKPEGCNVAGRVVDAVTGEGIPGVVASDGWQCTRTGADGWFYLTSIPSQVKFVWVSSPSGYLPPVERGLPVFYKQISAVTPDESGLYNFGLYEMTPVSRPDDFTLIISADPQPRASGNRSDRYAFHSLDVCEDYYQELHDVSAAITDRRVLGLCLGDIVHENTSLFGKYELGLSKLNYPTYNIIGNHDHNPAAADDAAGAADFESHFGPANYSFNAGGIHFVVLDDVLMKKNADGSLKDYDAGLTDAAMNWLRADLAYVPTSTTLVVCAHIPMFRQESGSERSNTAVHGADYGALLDQYDEVHAWAGHTHTSFNYVYPESHRHKRVQVHTLARSTGELWLNEYLASGTPRGFTVAEVRGGKIVSWRFHPTRYQRADWIGMASNGLTSKKPSYQWRDWDYDASGLAVMRGGASQLLDEDYQMHVYPRGAYGDNCVYVNVFLWDDKWEAPVFTPDGGVPVAMEKVTASSRHDLATTEIKTHYKTYTSPLHDSADYSGSTTGSITTLFRVEVPATPSRGTVRVTDRFGNTYSRAVSW